jgi:transposase
VTFSVVWKTREVSMPWKEGSVMEERLRFVARLLEGEAMSDVCREFGISRKTGYKLFNRYREDGPVALCDRSRRPVRKPAKSDVKVVALLTSCLPAARPSGES